jgi:homoaconitase/3-isopropylmalate dehydratase large subunit
LTVAEIHQVLLHGGPAELQAAAAVAGESQVHARVRAFACPATEQDWADCAESGVLQVLARAGWVILAPPLPPAELAPGETGLFSGPAEAAGRRVSPAEAAQAAVRGCIDDIS